ncbi:MAG TPA: twin-arginine translocase TatA/TatE family subunit [Solirubrobacteraceae bacterium]|nr:twin-arginine translocase TatA/TatE family subunit [Solirubrobacteraceae bacterium]
MGIESPVHLLFIGAVALLVLGPKRLPEVARALGKGLREFREAMGQEPATRPAPVPTGQPPAPPAGPASATTGVGGVYDLEPDPAGVDSLQHVDPAQQVPSAGAPDRRPL